MKYRDVYYSLLVAQYAIGNFINNSVFASSIRSSRSLAENLLHSIANCLSDDPNLDREIDEFLLYQVKNSCEQYKIALQAELSVTPAFFVTQKGSHDTISLLEYSESLFPLGLKNKVPEAMFDVKEAGKAIAFDMPTACGYHLFRATESVLRRYYSFIAKNESRPKVRSLGVYVKMMRSAKIGDEKIVSALDQMTRLHRNPIIHPEVALSHDEALSLIGISRSVVSAMIEILPKKPSTTINTS